MYYAAIAHVGVTLKRAARSAIVASPRSAARATLALKTGSCFRRFADISCPPRTVIRRAYYEAGSTLTTGLNFGVHLINRATVIGYLGQDPQLRYTPQGTPVCTLSVATDESYTNKSTGERKEAVEWHRVVVWGKQGSICAEKLAKGRQLYVEGKLSTRSYDKDGEKRYVTEIVALRVQFLGPKPNGGVAELPAADDSEIPF